MAIGLFHTVSALVGVCTKHVSRVSRKLRSQTSSLRSISPRKVHLSRRLSFMPFLGKKKDAELEEEKRSISEVDVDEEEEEEVMKEEGLWRRTILMGEKCQPLDFSGAIYYDNYGNQLPELPPRSPMRGSKPLPGFSFPAEKDGNY